MFAESSGSEWSSDVAAADWIRDGLRGFAENVGSVIPLGFEAYARVFHPAWRWDGHRAVKVRWAEIASWSGRVVHPEMQFHAIAKPVGHVRDEAPWDGENPPDGVLAADDTESLVDVLGRHTSTPDECWFCLWEGYGPLHGGAAVWPQRPGLVPPEVRAGPRVHLPHRDYYLYRGQISAAMACYLSPLNRSPNLWWPDDRAWCVASEIDFFWTYVGGSERLIDQILHDERFESLRARITDGVMFDSDYVNT